MLNYYIKKMSAKRVAHMHGRAFFYLERGSTFPLCFEFPAEMCIKLFQLTLSESLLDKIAR